MARRATQPGGRSVYPTGPQYAVPAGQGAYGRNGGYGGGPQGYGGGYGPSTGRKRFVDFPRAGRIGWRRWVPSWKLLAGIGALVLASLAVAFMTAYAATTIPSADALVSAQTTTIYYKDGKSEIGRLAEQNRRSVKFEEVPKHVRDAVIAAEDRSFYENSGVNPTSIARAAWSNARGNSLQGGSTITQQYVKNYFDLRDRTLTRKAKEFFIAMKIAQEKDKPEILTDYLNAIYLGRGAYGVEAASQAYFAKPVGKLTVSEGAFLAGIINGPELYDPREGEGPRTRAIQRWNYVLDGMVAEGMLSAADRAKEQFPEVIKEKKQNTQGGQRGYLISMALQELERKGYTRNELAVGGYKVVTTFEKGKVDDAVKAVRDTLPEDTPKGLQVGMATIDPRTGAVRSIYGGADYIRRNQNAATQDIAQAGSTYKPFTLVAALEKGISLRSRYDGESPMDFEGAKEPIDNFGDRSYGTNDLLFATANSVNTMYVQLNEEVTAKKTLDVAERAGIPKDFSGDANLANVLGTASPHPIDMASAYATFAAGGVRNEPYVVETVTKVGEEEPENTHKRKPRRVFEKEIIADATYAMQQVVERGSGEYAQRLGRDVAGKTGTSSNSESAWFVGYTPQLATAVAMYQLDKKGAPVEMKGFGDFEAITGGSYPIRIWTEFMEQALGDAEELEFPDPVFGGEIENPAPIQTQPPQQDDDGDEGDDGDDGDGDDRPTTAPTETSLPEPTRPRPTRTRLPFPTITLPTVQPGPPGDDD